MNTLISNHRFHVASFDPVLYAELLSQSRREAALTAQLSALSDTLARQSSEHSAGIAQLQRAHESAMRRLQQEHHAAYVTTYAITVGCVNLLTNQVYIALLCCSTEAAVRSVQDESQLAMDHLMVRHNQSLRQTIAEVRFRGYLFRCWNENAPQ